MGSRGNSIHLLKNCQTISHSEEVELFKVTTSQRSSEICTVDRSPCPHHPAWSITILPHSLQTSFNNESSQIELKINSGEWDGGGGEGKGAEAGCPPTREATAGCSTAVWHRTPPPTPALPGGKCRRRAGVFHTERPSEKHARETGGVSGLRWRVGSDAAG